MKTLITILCLVVPLLSFASDDTTKSATPHWVLKLAAGPNPEGYWPPTILPAVERRKGNYGYQFQIGASIPTDYSIQDTIDYNVLRGNTYWLSSRVELRKYKTLREKMIPGKREAYIGAELFGNILNTPRKDEYTNRLSVVDTTIYEDAFVLNKKMIGVGLVFGIQRYFGKKIIFGIHTGLGVKFKYTTAHHKVDADAVSTYIHGMFLNAADRVGYNVAFAMPVNFYLGYSFN